MSAQVPSGTFTMFDCATRRTRYCQLFAATGFFDFSLTLSFTFQVASGSLWLRCFLFWPPAGVTFYSSVDLLLYLSETGEADSLLAHLFWGCGACRCQELCIRVQCLARLRWRGVTLCYCRSLYHSCQEAAFRVFSMTWNPENVVSL